MNTTTQPGPLEVRLSDQLGLAVNRALFDPACQRLNEWALIGPVQRAALESFAERLLAAERERCAKLCDPTNADRPGDWTEYAKVRAECAARIRGA